MTFTKTMICAAALALAACGGHDEKGTPQPDPLSGNRLVGAWTLYVEGYCTDGSLSLAALPATADSNELASGTWSCGDGRGGEVTAAVAACDALSLAFSGSTTFTVSGKVRTTDWLNGTAVGPDFATPVPFKATRVACPDGNCKLEGAALAADDCP